MEKGIHTQTASIIICHCLKQCRQHQEKYLRERLDSKTQSLRSRAILENKKAFCRILSKPSTGADSMDGEIEVLLTF